MKRVATSVFAICALAALTGAPASTSNAPTGVSTASADIAVLSKSGSMWINRREYIVTAVINRVLTGAPLPDFAETNGEPMQVQITVQTADGATPEWMSSPSITIRGPRAFTSPSLNEQPQLALWPSNMRSWAGYYSKPLRTDSPSVRFSVRVRGREYAVNLSGVPINTPIVGSPTR